MLLILLLLMKMSETSYVNDLSVELLVQPEASITVTVLVPLVNPEAMEPVPVGVTVPGVGDHDTVNPLAVAPPPTIAVEVPGGNKQEG